MSLLQEHEDYANALLILLKFMLIVMINLQGLYGILHQLGLDPQEETGIVNTTPARQVTTNGQFRLSFYPILYGSGLTEDQFQITVYKCGKQLTDSGSCIEPAWDPRRGEEIPTQYEKLVEDLPQTILLQPEARAGADSDQRPRRIFEREFSLGEDVPGTFWVLYQVRFLDSAEIHGIVEPLEINYVLDDEPEWRIGPLQIVRGRSAPAPMSIRDFTIELRPDSRMELNRRLLGVRKYGGLSANSFEEGVNIATRVANIDFSSGSFTVSDYQGRSGEVVGRDAVFLRYNQDSGRFSRAEFRDLRPNHRVHFELQEENVEPDEAPLAARVVRFGEQLVASLGVVLQDNLAPRGIYRGDVSGRGDRVTLRIPRDLYRALINDSRIWYFNLNRHILDPDGVSSQGAPRVEIQRGRTTFETAEAARRNYQLVWDARANRQLLRVLDPFQVSEDELSLRIRDEWNSTNIIIEVRRMSYSDWDTLGQTIRR